MEKYRIEQNGETVTIWYDHANETTGENCHCVGLRFTQGETLQRYTSEIVLTDLGLFYTNLRGAEWMSEISNALTDYAAQQYPKEFEPIKPN